MKKVAFYEVFDEEEQELRKILPEYICAEFTSKTIQEKDEKTPPAEIISIRTQSIVPDDWAQQLKGILTRSQGYDHLTAYSQKTNGKVACGHLGNYCSRAVAEQAILMMMALLRKLNTQLENFSSFCRDGLTGLECKGRKVLVVGVGKIGSEIVDIAQGIKMEVKGVDIEPKLKGIEYVSLSEGIAWADVLFCALPLTEQTKGLLNYQALQGADSGLIFINIARGEISPIEDLQTLLQEGTIAGIGLDVYPQEGVLADALRAKSSERPSDNSVILKFSKNEGVLCTPHNAFNTREALKQKASLTVASIVACLEGKTFPFPVPEA